MGCKVYAENFEEHIEKFVGETVTIYTTSGGQSGCGFTGVLIHANRCFVRLLTCIGAAPNCAIGSSCNHEFNKCRSDNRCINNVGSVVDIPIEKIAAFVHNAE